MMSLLTRRLSGLATLALALLTPGARAQTSVEAPEGPRRLRIEMGRGQAILRLQLALRHRPETRITERSLALADNAVVVAMRARARSGLWLGASLQPAEATREAFLGQVGLAVPTGSWRVLVSHEAWVGPRIELTASGEPDQERPLEIVALAPTHYQDGREQLDLESMLEPGPLTVEVIGPRDGSQLLLDGEGVASGFVHTLGEAKATVALEPAESAPLRGTLALAVAGDRTLVRARLDTPTRLGKAPRAASVVIVLDVSRSMQKSQRRVAATLAQAYLERLPDARAAVIVFHRSVHALQSSLVSPAEAIASLARAPAPANGSRLDLALVQAAALLHEQPGPRRVLILTDGLAHSAMTAEVLEQATRATGALVHLGLVNESKSGVTLDRDDDHDWALAARATGGLLWRLAAPDHGRITPDQVESLVRPTMLEQLKVSWLGPGPKQLADRWPDHLAEGEGSEVQETVAGATGKLEVRGELWSTPVVHRLQASPEGDATWTRLAVGSALFGPLTEPQQRDLARRARVVSPFHSLLAVGPGVSDDLRSDADIGMSRGGLIGNMAHPAHVRTLSSTGMPQKQADLIANAVERAWHRCTGGMGTAQVTVQATLDEVVDVADVSASGGPAGAKV